MCSQGGAPLSHFPQAFIEQFLIPVINIYVAFYSQLTSSEAVSSSPPRSHPNSSILLTHFGEELQLLSQSPSGTWVQSQML